VGFLAEKAPLGQAFSKYFGFPCQFSCRRLLHTHHPSSGAGTSGSPRHEKEAADVPLQTILGKPIHKLSRNSFNAF
jgi:hypothetical protein